MSPAIKNLFSQKKSTGRAMHKAVAGEPIDEIEAFHFGHFTQEGMCVGTDLIETCPPAADANVFEQRHSGHGRLEMDQLPFAVNLLIEAGWFVCIGHACEDGGSFPVEIEVLLEIDDKRKIGWKLRDGRCHCNLSPDRDNRNFNPAISPSRAAQGPAAFNTMERRHLPVPGFYATDAAVFLPDAGDFQIRQALYAETPCSGKVPLNNPIGVG